MVLGIIIFINDKTIELIDQNYWVSKADWNQLNISLSPFIQKTYSDAKWRNYKFTTIKDHEAEKLCTFPNCSHLNMLIDFYHFRFYAHLQYAY